MPPSFFQRHFLLFVIGAIALTIAVQALLIAGEHYLASHPGVGPSYGVILGKTPTPTVTPAQTQPANLYQRPDFEAGIVDPHWTQNSYGPDDIAWQNDLPLIQAQTGARWLEMPVLFTQTSPTSTQVKTGQGTPTAESVVFGIRAARALGFHVFIVPLFSVDVQGAWAASIQFSTVALEQQWFDSFWQTFQPYVVAAQAGGAEQISIGTEEVWLQEYASITLWNTLIARVRSVFAGTITYDMNWTSLSDPVPAWFSNSDLGMVGVSEYIPLVDQRERLELPAIIPLWRDKVKALLDTLSTQIGKPVILSEIGYRNSADTLYHPWLPFSTVSPSDPVEQAAACDAALTNIIPDPHIMGTFFWGWDSVNGFKLSGQPAMAVLHKWYTSPQA